MWEEQDNQLVRHFKFGDFGAAFGFMTQVAMLAEKHDHHPTFVNTYADLTIRLSTHDAGNKITDKDYKLAKAIDSIPNLTTF